jgi:hypothetical protein
MVCKGVYNRKKYACVQGGKSETPVLRGVSRWLDRRRRLKIFKFFSVVGGGGSARTQELFGGDGGSDPRALRRRRLEILKFFSPVGGGGWKIQK